MSRPISPLFIAVVVLLARQASPDENKPALDAFHVLSAKDKEIRAVTDSQIRVLQGVIDSTPDDDPKKPDLLFQIAELFVEQQRYYNLKARELDEKIFDEQQKNNIPRMNQYKAQQKDYEGREKGCLLEAVKKYLAVANGPKYQSYESMDMVLNDLAYLLTQVRKEATARIFFKRLIKKYPWSPFLPNAYLSYGDFFFEHKDMEAALKSYEKVLQCQYCSVYGYALYKKGWVYYNQKNFKQAFSTFVEVIGHAENQGSSDSELAREGKKDMVRAFVQIGTPEMAWPFFLTYGKDYAPTMMEELAELYNAQGKFLDSIKTYRELIKHNRESIRLCKWQSEIVKNTRAMTSSRAEPETIRELQRLSAVYEKTAAMAGIKKEAVDECRDNTAEMLRELATSWHRKAQQATVVYIPWSPQKTGVMETYVGARDLYREYLRRFPKEGDSYLMHYWYADLLFKLGALDQDPASHWFCDAAPIYTDVVKLDPKGTKAKDAAYAAVISWMYCLDVSDNGADEKKAVIDDRNKKKSEETFAPKPIPDRQAKMLETFDTYIKYMPKPNQLVTIVTIKYRRARVFYEYNHFEQAIPLFKEIAENYTKSVLAIYSANLLLDCYAITKDFTALRAEVTKFLTMPDLMKDKEFKKQIDVVRNQ